MTHRYGDYDRDVFDTGRSIDHSRIVDIYMNNSYRSKEEFAVTLLGIAEKLEDY